MSSTKLLYGSVLRDVFQKWIVWFPKKLRFWMIKKYHINVSYDNNNKMKTLSS